MSKTIKKVFSRKALSKELSKEEIESQHRESSSNHNLEQSINHEALEIAKIEKPSKLEVVKPRS